MPYWELVTRSFQIAWRHKYLWLLAIFALEGGGGFNFNSSSYQPTGASGSRSVPNFHALIQPQVDWITQHVALIVVATVVIVMVWIALFILAAACEGALIRAAAEHDAGRPFDLGTAWCCGLGTMGTLIRFRLLLICLYLPVGLLLLALAAALVLALYRNDLGTVVALAVGIGFLALVAIPYAIYVSFLDRLGARAVVLEQVSAARDAIGRGHRLLGKRLGRVLLVWLLSIATGIVVGIALAVIFAILLVPFFIAAVGASMSGSPALWALVAGGIVVLLPLVLTVGGFVGAQASTYWTLAFRRLEIDQAPAYAYRYPTPAPPAAPAQGTPSA